MSAPDDRAQDPPGQAAGPPAGPPGRAGRHGGLSPVQGRAVVTLFLIGAVGGFGNLFWTSHEVAVNQGKWCALIVTLDEANATAAKKPAPGSVAAEYAAEISRLRQDLGCPAARTAQGRNP